MPDKVIDSTGKAALGTAGTLAGLAVVASIGASVLGASVLGAFAVAANLFPPEQLGQLVVTQNSATVQNFLHHTCATLAQGGMHTIPTMQAPAPAALYRILSPLTMQVIAAAPSQAQTMLPALSPPAAVVTGSKISAVIAAKLVTVGKAVAVTVCHFFWPVVITIGVCGALFVLYKLRQLALEATRRGQQRLSRRRTGPSMPLL